jgi:choline dehydrogenase-like flavoprotein
MAAARQDRADVLVIGAGVAGSFTALRLAQAGFRVVCLEQSSWTDPSEVPGSKPEWELQATRSTGVVWALVAGSRRLAEQRAGLLARGRRVSGRKGQAPRPGFREKDRTPRFSRGI